MDTLLSELSPARLTRLLQAGGHLSHGNVEDVHCIEVFETPPSTLARLSLTYSSMGQSSAPELMLLKTPKPHKLAAGAREVDFYTRVMTAMPNLPIPRALVADRCGPNRQPFLLLEDLSTTHEAAPMELSAGEVRALLDTLARLHAMCWNHPRLVEVAGDPMAALDDWNDNIRYYAELEDMLGDRLTQPQRAIFEAFLARGQALLGERAQKEPQTLVHPDGHPHNFLLPRQPGGPVYVIDWHQYRPWFGPRDVAVLLYRCHTAEHRADGGRASLRDYYAALLAYGVRDYSWEQCWADYRLGVIEYLAFPLQSRRVAMAHTFVERSMEMLYAVGAQELLGLRH